jgi:hypothetical protein
MVPVATAQVGCMVVAAVAAAGAVGCAFMVVEVATELHPPTLLIITSYVPAANPDFVLLAWKVVPLSKL